MLAISLAKHEVLAGAMPLFGCLVLVNDSDGVAADKVNPLVEIVLNAGIGIDAGDVLLARCGDRQQRQIAIDANDHRNAVIGIVDMSFPRSLLDTGIIGNDRLGHVPYLLR